MLERIRHAAAAHMGAAAAWLVPAADAAEALGWLGLDEARVVPAIDPVALDVADVRALSRGTSLLVVDATLPTMRGCAACRLGADVCVDRLAWAEGVSGLVAVGLSREAAATVLRERLNGAQASLPVELDLSALLDALASLDVLERRRADAAQVLASYLACHPCVSSVRYPGLTHDPAFHVAARTLSYGFGPRVGFVVRGGADAGALASRLAGLARLVPESSAERVLLDCEACDPSDLVMAVERALAG
jgi:O-acetylhomoserine/O-acetylserine sulfhydrylase-like pyridoxal-dependent enzyme